ncbi:MAG TPA: PIN domain-containing protein [Solirubrobacteraceae bacterium]|nr:PIN domain-containing protein [Solirubrobacteraceae bacterium]
MIADTSAWITARRIPPRARRCSARSSVVTSRGAGAARYELAVDARDGAAITAVDRTLDALREIRVDWSMQREVLATMRGLASQQAHGAHRLPLADLTVAVAARTAGLDVVHFDRHFERLGALLDIRVWWLAHPSSA